MKQILLLSMAIFYYGLSFSQVQQVSVGKDYRYSVFYSLFTGEQTTVDYTKWDIAFDVSNRGLSVLVNEAVSSAGTGVDANEVALYLADTDNFEAVDTSGQLTRLYNGSGDWSEGGFSVPASKQNPFDFGWGLYDPSSHIVQGNRVFVLQLRDKRYIKCSIDRLEKGIYYFTYSDLDNTNVVKDSIVKADYTGKQLAYYSFQNQEALDLEPQQWDLKFTRYVTSLDDMEGGYIDYNVTGVLSKSGVEVLELTGVDPKTVDYSNYPDSLWSSNIETIGHDWKRFDLASFQYSIPESLVYFVKTATDSVWRLTFIDFEGSSTGVITFEKKYEGVLSALSARGLEFITEEVLFPNPAFQNQPIQWRMFSDQTWSQGRLALYNNLGQLVHQQEIQIQYGENLFTLPTNYAPGMYHAILIVNQRGMSKSFIIK